MTFVDTNYFLRFLLADNNEQYKAAAKLFKEGASGSVKLISSTIVFFEIYWVLKSHYQVEKEALCKALENLLRLSFILVPERGVLETALVFYRNHNLSLEDCYHIAFATSHEVTDFKTFDAKLHKLYRGK